MGPARRRARPHLLRQAIGPHPAGEAQRSHRDRQRHTRVLSQLLLDLGAPREDAHPGLGGRRDRHPVPQATKAPRLRGGELQQHLQATITKSADE